MSVIMPPWSFSAIECFEQCPRKYYHRYILKEKGPQSPQMIEGNKFDAAVEARVRDGIMLPPEYQIHEPYAASIANAKGPNCKVYTQLKMGITKDFEPCGFFDKKVWGRGVLDIGMIAYPTAIISDWKTGKNNEGKGYSSEGLQLRIFSALLFKHFPRIEKVTAFNLWLQTQQIGKPYVYTRLQQGLLWQDILPRIMKIEQACATGNFPELSGPLCGYCDVKICPHNRS